MGDRMHTNHQLRSELIVQAEIAYIGLLRQVDLLFEHTVFYLERYPMQSRADEMRTAELNFCIGQLGDLPTKMASVLEAWKKGIPSPLSRDEMELDVLNEYWANMSALVCFLMQAQIDLDPFSLDDSTKYFYVLNRANRVLT
jgi:hypothetical protein